MTAQADIAEYALGLGDDALVHAQRLAEWCADAPLLEEDIALANVGLDYLGRARMFLQLTGNLTDKSEDELAYLRDAPEFRNLLIFELPRGDFAFTMVRQYLLDEYELLFFAALAQSSDSAFADIAEKTLKEVRYHQRRSLEWLRRLGLGTEESNHRAQKALDELWGYVAEFFSATELEERLIEANVVPDRRSLETAWRAAVGNNLASVELQLPGDDWQVLGGRDGQHTEHLSHMLGELQFLQRAYPGQAW